MFLFLEKPIAIFTFILQKILRSPQYFHCTQSQRAYWVVKPTTKELNKFLNQTNKKYIIMKIHIQNPNKINTKTLSHRK